ncbi:Gfo/Idh/MocA family oxidoreductase [candidate division KSB1 bacterium]|nr:Gfo/Idh/MocA family oxidoreductase [candidate division KSB1 bacterium]
MLQKTNLSRREFIKKSTAGAAGLTVASNLFSLGNVLGANERVRVAAIGTGRRCRSLIRGFHQFSKEMNMEMVAVCDLWKIAREEGTKLVEELSGKKPKVYRNTDELYEKEKNLDAVIIGTGDFQHAIPCAEAVRLGKDVYVEKPLANNFDDARNVRKAVLESDRVVQMGTQRRSSGHYKTAKKIIESGAFGELRIVEMNWNVNQPKRWRREEEAALLREEDVDWKRWLLNRPYQPFDPRKYLEFRLFWPYSSGLPCQWMSHQIDTVAWFADDPYPAEVAALGDIYQWKDGRENPDTFAAVFKYPKGFQVNYTARQTNSYGGTKEVYLSNLGALDTGQWILSGDGGRDGVRPTGKNGNLLEETYVDDKGRNRTKGISEPIVPTEQGEDHIKNWMECLRSRKTPNADIEAGYSHSVALCMVIEAMHTGKRVRFDPDKHEILVD